MAEWILRRKRRKYFELYGKGTMLTNADVKHGVFFVEVQKHDQLWRISAEETFTSSGCYFSCKINKLSDRLSCSFFNFPISITVTVFPCTFPWGGLNGILGNLLAAPHFSCTSSVQIRAANDPSVFTITEKAPNRTRAFSWLKVPNSAFLFKKVLRHNAKRALSHGE